MTKEELMERLKTDEEYKAMFERSKELDAEVMELTTKIRLIDNEVLAKIGDGYTGYRNARFSKLLDDITDILVERKAMNDQRRELLEALHEITKKL